MLDSKIVEILAVDLSKLPDPTYWFKELRRIKENYDENTKSTVAILAKRYWLKRVCGSSLYPINDIVKEDLIHKNHFLNDDDNLLVWATIVALIDGDDAEMRYQLTQNGIIKKYGVASWKRVKQGANKINNILARKNDEQVPYTLLKMAEQSITVRSWVQQHSGRDLPRKV